MAEDNYAKNARQDALRKKENEDYKKHLEREKEENEAPRKALSDAFDYVKGKASEFGDNVSKYAKEYGEVYKKGLGMKSGGKINLKDCKVNTAEKRNPKHKNF